MMLLSLIKTKLRFFEKPRIREEQRVDRLHLIL